MFLHPDHLQKLSKLRTPEDIARWREERKANFPTRQKREASTVASTVASSTEGQQTSDQLESGQQAIVVDNHNQSRADKSKHQDRSKFKRNNDFRSPNGKRRNVPTLYEKVRLIRLILNQYFF